MTREYTGKVYEDHKGNLFRSRLDAIRSDLRRTIHDVDPDTNVASFEQVCKSNPRIVFELLVEGNYLKAVDANQVLMGDATRAGNVK